MQETIICSYNIRAGYPNYLDYLPEVPEVTDLPSYYENVRKMVAKFLPGKADVFCFQEVREEMRPELQSLEQKQYQIIRLTKQADTALAINLEKFGSIVDYSFSFPPAGDVAAAEAVEISSGKKFGFASAHISDENLEEANQEQIMKEGDNNVEMIALQLDQIFKDCDVIILGGDFNAVYDQYPKRFSQMEKQGYKIERTWKATHTIVGEGLERESDYFATKFNLSKKERLLNAILKTHKMEIFSGYFQPGFNPKTNSSDHIPIYLKVFF